VRPPVPATAPSAPRVVAYTEEQESEDQPRNGEDQERCSPSPLRGHQAAGDRADDDAQRAAGLERSEHRGAAIGRMRRRKQSRPRWSEAGLADTDPDPRSEQRSEPGGDRAGRRRTAPHGAHQRDRPDAAPAIHCHREGKRAERNRHRDRGHQGVGVEVGRWQRAVRAEGRGMAVRTRTPGIFRGPAGGLPRPSGLDRPPATNRDAVIPSG
jgi:hypothetical protein